MERGNRILFSKDSKVGIFSWRIQSIEFRKAIGGPSYDASGTWIKLEFFLEQAAFDTRIDPIQGAKYSTRIEEAAYSALNRRRDQSCHLKAE
ncbi:LOW QUALITY PROTEIN: hypothetical protein V1478_002213 [Vespula squamosa]|uniref:Uncharacterized protein n=1 Tax=Vespula squamosa TaxID=30214 RepID=A0ABD2BW16_VESSQ